MNVKSIVNQTNYSYSISFRPTGYEYFQFGFSGSGNSAISHAYSGLSGELFENAGLNFYSYEPGQTIEISGNVVNTSQYNFFINNVPIKTLGTAGLVSTDCFFYEGIPAPELTFYGSVPNASIASGVIKNEQQTGEVYFRNQSAGVAVQVYSGDIHLPSGEIFSFTHPINLGVSNTTDFRTWGLNTTYIPQGESTFSVEATLYTNYGVVENVFNIYYLYDLIVNFDLIGGNSTQQTGDYDYFFEYSVFSGQKLSTAPYDVEFNIISDSGVGDYFDYTGIAASPTGNSNASFDVNLGVITGSGLLTGIPGFEVSGYNTYLNRAETGVAQPFTGGYVKITSDSYFNYNIPATGMATGTIFAYVTGASGGYNFEETGLMSLTGGSYSGQISHVTGVTHTGI